MVLRVIPLLIIHHLKSTIMSNLIKSSGVALVTFARNFRSVEVKPFTNSETGEQFKSLVFEDADKNYTMVNFSSQLGELTPAEITARKDELQVVSMDSGTHILCKKGEMPAGEAVLGLI